jgi:hypothetical protein
MVNSEYTQAVGDARPRSGLRFLRPHYTRPTAVSSPDWGQRLFFRGRFARGGRGDAAAPREGLRPLDRRLRGAGLSWPGGHRGCIVQSNLLPAWIGWTTIAWNLILLIVLLSVTPGDIYYPVAHHLMPRLIAVPLLWRASG